MHMCHRNIRTHNNVRAHIRERTDFDSECMYYIYCVRMPHFVGPLMASPFFFFLWTRTMSCRLFRFERAYLRFDIFPLAHAFEDNKAAHLGYLRSVSSEHYVLQVIYQLSQCERIRFRCNYTTRMHYWDQQSQVIVLVIRVGSLSVLTISQKHILHIMVNTKKMQLHPIKDLAMLTFSCVCFCVAVTIAASYPGILWHPQFYWDTIVLSHNCPTNRSNANVMNGRTIAGLIPCRYDKSSHATFVGRMFGLLWGYSHFRETHIRVDPMGLQRYDTTELKAIFFVFFSASRQSCLSRVSRMILPHLLCAFVSILSLAQSFALVCEYRVHFLYW